MAAQKEQFSQPQIAYTRGPTAPYSGLATVSQRQSGGRAEDGDRGVCCVADCPGSISLEILHRWDAVRRYLTDGPGSLVSCR